MADYTGPAGNGYRLRLRMNAVGRTTADINANQTRVTWDLYILTGARSVNAYSQGSITVGGTTYSIPYASRNHGNPNTTYHIMGGTRTVKHNSNGNGSIYGTAHYYSSDGSPFYAIPRINVSGTLTLSRINQFPNAPGTPTASQSGNTVRVTSGTAGGNGNSILEYQIRRRNYGSGTWSGWISTGVGTGRVLTFNPALHGTNYQFQSRARTSRGWGPWSGTRTFATLPRTLPAVVSEILPTSARVQFTRDGRADGTTTWQLQYATNSAFTSATTISSTGTSNLTDLTPGTNYWVRSRGSNSAGTGQWSAVTQFMTMTGSAPTLTILTDFQGNAADAVIVLSGIAPTAHQVEWRYVSGPTSPSGNAQGSSPLRMAPLTPGVTYEARARSIVGSYETPWTAWQTFTTPNPGTVLPEYFDGSSPNLTDIERAWLGTSNASPSIGYGKIPLRAYTGADARVYRTTGTLISGSGYLARALSVVNGSSQSWIGFRGNTTATTHPASELVAYTFSMYVRASDDMRVSLSVQFRNSGGSTIDSSATYFDLVAGQTRRINATLMAPEGTTQVWTALTIQDSLSDSFVDIDGVMLNPGGLLPYFDGSTPDTSADTYEWEGTTDDSTSIHRKIVGAVVDAFEDPDCPPPPAPPRPPAVENPCVEDTELWRRYWVHVNRDSLRARIDVLPTFTVLTGSVSESNVRIRIYENPDNLGVDEFVPGEFVSEQVIVNMPANAEVVLDGLSERATGRVGNSPWQSVDHLVFGSNGTPPTYPVLSCDTSYLVAFDVPIESPAGNLNFLATLTDRFG